ncbi:hypothetical protein LCGC14_2176290, partial [marine sediment metagenome]
FNTHSGIILYVIHELIPPANCCLAVARTPVAVHVDPLNSSVTADTVPVVPPVHKASVVLPPPAGADLAVLRLPVDVHDTPSYVAATAETEPVTDPPTSIALKLLPPTTGVSLSTDVMFPPADQLVPLYSSVVANLEAPSNPPRTIAVKGFHHHLDHV